MSETDSEKLSRVPSNVATSLESGSTTEIALSSSLFCVSVPVLSQKTYSIWPSSSYRFSERASACAIDFVSICAYIIHASPVIFLAENNLVASITMISYSGIITWSTKNMLSNLATIVQNCGVLDYSKTYV